MNTSPPQHENQFYRRHYHNEKTNIVFCQSNKTCLETIESIYSLCVSQADSSCLWKGFERKKSQPRVFGFGTISYAGTWQQYYQKFAKVWSFKVFAMSICKSDWDLFVYWNKIDSKTKYATTTGPHKTSYWQIPTILISSYLFGIYSVSNN